MFLKCLGTIVLACIVLSTPVHLQAADTARDLQSKVARLNAWLGSDDNAEAWRRFLNLNVLETQTAKGNRADVETLRQILNRFSSGSPGLQRPAFVMVRDAIQEHLLQISVSRSTNLDADIAAAQSRFRPIDLTQFDRLRNAAIQDTRMLKWYIRQNLDSRLRAEVFFELKPDELVAFLKQLQVELPPLRSAEVISEEIQAMQNRAGEIDIRIQQLNEQIEKINKWMQNPEKLKDDDIAPPAPDDDAQTANTKPPQSEAPSGGEPSPADEQSGNQDIQPDRKPVLEMESRNLTDELQQIEAQIKQLQEEADQLKITEGQRNRRRAEVLNELRRRSAGFDNLDGQYNDAFFAAAQDSVQSVVRGYFYATDSGLANDFKNRIRILQENYDKLDDPTQRRAAAQVGAALGWLESAMQVPALVTAVRARHSLPNLQISISGNLLNRLGGRPVNEPQPVNEMILGRLIRGRARVCGNVNIDLIDDPNQVHASLQLLGNVNSDTYTRSGRITAYAGSNASIEARRSVFANIGGFYANAVYGAAQLSSYLKGIDNRIRIIQRIAQKQYLKDKQLAESISAGRLENRMIPEFTRQTDEAIANGNQQFQQLQQRQEAESKMLPSLYLFSWQKRLNAIGHKTSLFDLAAPQPALAVSMANPEIHVKLHETMLSNYASPLLAGRTFTNEELAERLGQLVGELPKPEGDEEGFQISFDTVRPIQFEFFDNTIAATITGRRFRQGRNTIPAALMIKIRYRIHRGNDGKLYLRRAGDVTVDYVDPEKKNARTVAFKSFLEDRLNKVTSDEKLKNIELPDNLIPVDQVPALQDRPLLRQLYLVQLRIENGWLYVGWDHVPGSWVGMHIVDTPAILGDARDNDLEPGLSPEAVPAESAPSPNPQ